MEWLNEPNVLTSYLVSQWWSLIWPLSCPPNLTRLFDGADSLPPQRAHHGEPTKDLWDPVLHWSPGSDGGERWDPVSGILPWNYRIDINLEPYAEEDHPLSFVIEAKIDQNRSFDGDPGTFAASPQHVFRPSDVADVPCCKPTMSWQRRARICPWGDQPMPMTRMRFWRSRTKA